MSLNQAIKHKKEHRKPYRLPEAIDKTCRNHGSCNYCYGNRVHKYQKDVISTDQQLQDYKNGLLEDEGYGQ